MTRRQILITSGSIRQASVHSLLARTVAGELEHRDRPHLFVDLADFVMPIYHGDDEESHGVPAAAHSFAELLTTAGGLLIASPEYNGSFTPLLKNTVDWVTRVDIGVLRDTYIGLMAASPGRFGGTRGMEMVRTWFSNMTLAVADAELSVPAVHTHIDDSGGARRFDDATSDDIASFVDDYLGEFDEYCLGRPVT